MIFRRSHRQRLNGNKDIYFTYIKVKAGWFSSLFTFIFFGIFITTSGSPDPAAYQTQYE